MSITFESMIALTTRLAYFGCGSACNVASHLTFQALLLLDRVAAADHWPTEADPVEELVEGPDPGGLGADAAAELDVAKIVQQQQRMLDAPQLAEDTVEAVLRLNEPSILITIEGMTKAT